MMDAMEFCFGLASRQQDMQADNHYLYQMLEPRQEEVDIALVSHDYSDRYELSISNND